MHIMPDLYGTRDINVFYCVYLVLATDHYIKVTTSIPRNHGPAVKQLNLSVSVFQVTYVVVSLKLEGIVK